MNSSRKDWIEVFLIGLNLEWGLERVRSWFTTSMGM
jgi:hypothetical protein